MRLDVHTNDGGRRAHALQLLHEIGIAQELETHHLRVLFKSPMLYMLANVVGG